MIEEQLVALAVDTRRRIYNMLIERPRSVRELADDLPVSRPAVSQHLKVLVDAGLARSSNVGTRRVYSPDPAGVAAVRQWADRMWAEAVGRFADFAFTESEEDEMLAGDAGIEPVVKTIRVALTPEAAFELFTKQMSSWWPLATHSVGEDRAVSVRIEAEVGGRVLETTIEGVEHEWGRVTAWEQGRHVEFTWHPGLPEGQETLVDVRFRDARGGCEMILVHSGWEARGEDGPAVRRNYDRGWDHVLGEYRDKVGAAS